MTYPTARHPQAATAAKTWDWENDSGLKRVPLLLLLLPLTLLWPLWLTF